MHPAGRRGRVAVARWRPVLVAATLAIAVPVPAPVAAVPRATVHERVQARAPVLPPPPATTRLISAVPSGAYPVNDGRSTEPAVSADGRWVAFQSEQADLTDPPDQNGQRDVFVRDVGRNRTVRLGYPKPGSLPSGYEAVQPSISADGGIVAFTVRSFEGVSFVVAWNRASGSVSLVSRVGTRQLKAADPSVSGDGRYVAYTAIDDAVEVKDANKSPDVYRFDRSTGRTTLVSVGQRGGAAGGSSKPSISFDGSRVAFISLAADILVPFNPGPRQQVYVADLAAGRMLHASGRNGGGPANGLATEAAISADGRYVAFSSGASDIVADDRNARSDVFRRDLETETTVLASVLPDGGQAAGASGDPAISSDGAVVAFVAAADSSEFPVRDVWARDVGRGETILVSVTVSGGSGGQVSGGPAIGGSGRFIAFHSDVPGEGDKDFNRVEDVFLRDLPPSPVLDPQLIDFGTVVIGQVSQPASTTLTNYGWSPLAVLGSSLAGAGRAAFSIAIEGCATRLLRRGESCTVTLVYLPTTQGPATAQVRLASRSPNSPLSARLRGIGSLATVTLNPPVGPPGTVTVAEGSGFPPNVNLALTWSVGITPKLPPVRTDGSGRFRVQVLVFHHDRIGERDLVVTPLLTVGLSPITARMTVVTPTMVPPGLLLLRLREGSRLRLFGRG